MWSYSFNINPVAASRPRVTRAGHTYYAGPYKDFKVNAQIILEDQLGESWTPLADPLIVNLDFYVKPAKGTKLWTPRADVDNYIKAIFDTLNTERYPKTMKCKKTKKTIDHPQAGQIKSLGFWEDDKQVVAISSTKQFTENHQTEGRIDITIDIDRMNYENQDGTWRYVRYGS